MTPEAATVAVFTEWAGVYTTKSSLEAWHISSAGIEELEAQGVLVPREQERPGTTNGDTRAHLKLSRPELQQSPARMSPEERATQKRTPPSRG
jgi:hypothetical protein